MANNRNYDFEYSMLDVMDALHIPNNIASGRTSGNYKCFFCDDRKKHLNINIASNTYRCNRCSAYGGMLDLYVSHKGGTKQEAHADMMAYIGKQPEQVKNANRSMHKQAVVQYEIEVMQRPRHERHYAYKTLLNSLSLRSAHRKDLLRRGMTDHEINKLGYKSVPLEGHQRLAAMLEKEGVNLANIPGFFKNKTGKWSVYAPYPGYFIPVRGLDGYIGGMQIRLDRGKYLPFFSTDMSAGTKSLSELHFVGDFSGGYLLITEGILKADMTYYLYRRLCPDVHFSVIGTPGAGSLCDLEEVLIELGDRGFHTVVEAQDRDKYKEINENVYQAKKKLWSAMERACATWEHDYTLLSLPRWSYLDKGFDDTLKLLLEGVKKH